MTPADFLHALESALQQRRVAFSRGDVIAFVESCWELIDDNPDVDAWADRFAEVVGGWTAACLRESRPFA